MTTTTYTDLRQRMIDGDTTVTAAALDKARREADFAQVQADAAAAAAERETVAKRERDVADLNTEARRLVEASSTEMQQHYRTALDAMRSLRHEMAAFNARVFKVEHTSSRLDAVLDVDPPAQFNVEFEMDRFYALTKHDNEPTPPFSRLYVSTTEE